MTTTEFPRTIQATVHPDALNRVPDFFNASLTDTLNELFQNARRSGATRLNITRENQFITIEDDGRGIADPQALLSFGHSQWDEETQRREHPAGMGIYSLARREKTIIRSKTADSLAWAVTLGPKNFTGEEPAYVERMYSRRTPGTSVTIATQNQNPESEIQRAASHFPLPVTLNGEPLQQKDFLHNCEYIETWNGLRIGVSPHSSHLRINFHGAVVEDRDHQPIHSLENRWYPTIDVVDCPQLQLTLPARKEIVKTGFINELKEACDRAIYRAMAQSSEPVDVAREHQQKAAALGVQLPDARPMLKYWEPGKADYNHHSRTQRQQLPNNPLVMSLYLVTPDEQAIGHALKNHAIRPRMVQDDQRMAGYDWHDQLTRIHGHRISVQYGNETHDLQDLKENVVPQERPDGIFATLTMSAPDTDTEEITIPMDFVFLSEEGEYIDDIETLLAKDAQISPEELAELLHDAYFNPSDDPEADSYHTQEHFHRQACAKMSVETVYSHADALKHNLAEAADLHLVGLLPKDTTAVITIERFKPVSVEVTQHEQDGEQ